MSGEAKPIAITLECSKCTAEPNAKCNEECKAVKSKCFKVTTKTERKELEKMIRDFVGKVLGRTLEDNDSLMFEEKGQNGEDSVSIDWLLLAESTNKTFCVKVTRSSSINNLPKSSKSDDSPFKVPNIPEVDQNNNFHYMGNEQKESTIKKVGLMRRYLATRNDACFTIVRKNLLCTFAHGSHAPPEKPDQPGWKIGDVITDIVLFDGSKIDCIVKKIEVNLDCVWLKPTKDIEIPSIAIDPPFYSQEIIALGLSGIYQRNYTEENNIIHKRTSYDICNVSCASLDDKNHCKTSKKAAPGDSGGPIFDYWDGRLIGMIVGAEAYSGSTEETGCVPSRDRDHQAPSITTHKQLLSDILSVAQSGGFGGKGVFISSFILASGYTENE